MRDIVVPDVDEAFEDEAETLRDTDTISAAAVTALIATLRLRGAGMPGSGAMIVRWCDHGEQIEFEIEAWPSDVPPRTARLDSAMLDALFEEPRAADPFADAAIMNEAGSAERPPRRDCKSWTIGSSRLHRRMRRR